MKRFSQTAHTNSTHTHTQSKQLIEILVQINGLPYVLVCLNNNKKKMNAKIQTKSKETTTKTTTTDTSKR